MGNPARTQDRGSREGNLPAGVNLPAGGCEGSDDSQHGESREIGVTPTSLSSSEVMGEGGASVKEEGIPTKGVVWVRYSEKGREPVVLKLQGDPFEIANAAGARLGFRLMEKDTRFDAMWAKRVKDKL